MKLTAMICPNCHANLDEANDFSFCPYCGAPIQKDADYTINIYKEDRSKIEELKYKDAQNKRTYLFVLLIIGGMAVFVIVMLIIFYLSGMLT